MCLCGMLWRNLTILHSAILQNLHPFFSFSESSMQYSIKRMRISVSNFSWRHHAMNWYSLLFLSLSYLSYFTRTLDGVLGNLERFSDQNVFCLTSAHCPLVRITVPIREYGPLHRWSNSSDCDTVFAVKTIGGAVLPYSSACPSVPS